MYFIYIRARLSPLPQLGVHFTHPDNKPLIKPSAKTKSVRFICGSLLHVPKVTRHINSSCFSTVHVSQNLRVL